MNSQAIARFLFCVFVCLVLHISPHFAIAEEQWTEEKVRQLFKDLSDGDFEKRETASQKIWEAGEYARKLLEAGVKSDDGELSFRSREILQKLNLGIRPNMGEDLVRLLSSYPGADLTAKRSTLNKLLSENRAAIVLRLIESEHDPAQQKALMNSLGFKLGKLAIPMIAGGKLADAENLIRLAANRNSTESLRDYAAFLYLTGELDAEVVRLEKFVAEKPGAMVERNKLAKLLITRGDFDDAKRLLVPTKKYSVQKSLLADIHFRQRDFESLATDPFIPGDSGLEHEGFAASYHRLAGNTDQFETAIANLKNLAAEDRSDTYMICEQLMINDCWEQTIELLEQDQQYSNAMRILVEQGEIEQAFGILGIDDPRNGNVVKWFDSQRTSVDSDSKDFHRLFGQGVQLTRLLNRLKE